MATPPDFTAGQVLTAAQMNAIGLWLVKTQTIGSAVSSVTVSDAFSADYDAYKITITGGVASTAIDLKLQLGATTSGYRQQALIGGYGNTPTALGSTGEASFIRAGGGTSDTLNMNVELLNPFLAKPTIFAGQFNNTTNYVVVGGYLDGTTSYTAFTILTSSGTITGGTIRVYGYRN